ncbi:flagellar hook-length control protein [Mycolicibacterium sp. 141076]|uniref:flagellar hook-length control protein n=1 Tax=Mycobacteriaceae TaxID=1762 RepID=UPI00299E08A1|nr:flagellar hook-length control protein [Mycolicibacterium sp. 141076]MDX1880087.1 flagellar hook-length control protein [Mycolicibacterium sp. 141076]
MSTAEDTKRAIAAVMQVAEDLAAGRITAAEVEGPAVEQCRALFERVAGPGDALWDLQCQVARKVLGMGGIPANELAEWVAVMRRCEGRSWIERALAEGADDEDE